jgi:mono/diheme cytochrome c family protein
MLLTLVFGAMTGVGIWFTIALINPDATSFLIHTFVFAWAIEWVFFVIEIVTAFLYFYTFEKVSEKTHMLIGWIYFIAAWASLFIINGILSFMLTPGKWAETQNFWDGMFNPTFWPSLVFRTFLCFALAGSYALLTAAKKFTGEAKENLVKYNGKWILYSLAGMIPSLLWYYFSLPEPAKQGLTGASYIMKVSLVHLIAGVVVFLLLSLLFVIWKARRLSFAGSIVILLSIFVFFGAFEFIREAGRKPYIINNYMYSTGLTVQQQEALKDLPFLRHAKWVQTREITAETELKAGEEIFRVQCYACHTFGLKNNINSKMALWDLPKTTRIMGSLRGITPYMSGFVGTEAEKNALAKWLYRITHKGKPEPPPPAAPGTAEAPAVQGETVFRNFCADCHEINDSDSIMIKLGQVKGIGEISDMLGKLDELSEDMPPFEGTEEEKKALADYLNRLRSKK